MWGTFLNILAIVGVVIVGAIIVYLIAYLAVNGLNKGKCADSEAGLAVRQKRNKVVRPTVLATNELDGDLEKSSELHSGLADYNANSWNSELAEEEQKALHQDKDRNDLFFDEEPIRTTRTERDFDEFDNIFEDKADKAEELDEKDLEGLMNKITVESLAEYNASKDVSAESDAGIVKETPKLALLNKGVESEEVESEEEDDEEDEEDDFDEVDYEQERLEIEEQRKELEQEQASIEEQRTNLEEQKKLLEEEKRRLEELKTEQSNIVAVEDMPSMYSGESVDKLKARLEVLNERLKQNKKDLRENRREYNPLARVKKTLDKDKAKLTRREAIVARQKIILYGVNNYVDIDEDKAKKLNEDLDLLDGLRLSVQHCEEVMQANKERFPILENTNGILRKVNTELLSDIAEIEQAIADKESENAE